MYVKSKSEAGEAVTTRLISTKVIEEVVCLLCRKSKQTMLASLAVRSEYRRLLHSPITKNVIKNHYGSESQDYAV